MAFFGLSDITFDKGPPTRNGPLGDLVNSKFQTTTLRYPLDVGNYDKGHYMVFYVRTQEKSAFPGTVVEDSIINESAGIATGGVTPQNALNNLQNSVAAEINGALSKVTNSITSGINQITQAVGLGSVSNPFGQSGISFGGTSSASQAVFSSKLSQITSNERFVKTTKLTTDAIALYMPDTLLYSHQQSYDQLSIGSELGGQLLAAGKSAVAAYEETGDLGKAAGSVGKSALEGALQVAGQGAGKALGSGGTAQVLLAQTGRVINPMLEMVYKSPAFRTFQFDFTFYPRDEKEALEVQKIIETFRFHQAPELLQGAKGFLVPPSEFDIRFYYGGQINPNIPAVATCVLTSIDLNYAPNGFAAYEVPGVNTPGLGATGMPVAIQVTLQFQETTYLTKSDFNLDRVNTSTENTGAVQRTLNADIQ